MNKKLILIFALFLIALPLISAFSTDPNDYVFWDDGDQIKNGSFRAAPANNDEMDDYQRWSIWTGYSWIYTSAGQKIGNMSIRYGAAGAGGNDFDLGSALTDATLQFTFYDDATDTSGYVYLAIKDASNTVWAGMDTAVELNEYLILAATTGITRTTGWHNLTFYASPLGDYVDVYFDGVVAGNITVDVPSLRYIRMYSDTNIDWFVDYIVVWNGTPDERPTGAVSDTTPPVVNTSINNTAPKINEIVNISANITDETGLSFCQVIENQTGSIIYTNYSLSGTTGKCSKAITVSVSRGNVINFTIRANDTTNNWDTNDTIITVANTPPSFSSASISPSNGKTDQSLTGSTSGYSDADSDSESGSTYKWYKNDAIIGGETTTSLASSNFVRGDVIIFEAKPKDGFDFGNPVNSSTSTIADTVASVSIGINDTAPKINEVVNVSSNVTDADGLSWCLIKTNQTGAFTNNTFKLSGTSGFCSDPITISVNRGNVVNFTVEINDTVGNIIYENSTKVTVANTNPTQPNIVNTTNKHYNTNITINITPSTDADSDTLTYFWFRNTTASPTPTLLQSGTTATSWITTIKTGDGTYHYFVNVSDGTVNVTGDMWNWVLDTVIPVMTDNLTGYNNSYLKGNLTVNVSVIDTYIYNLTMNLTNGTWTFEFYFNDSVGGGTRLELIKSLNLTGLKDGQYNLTFESIDSHSEPIDQNKFKTIKKSESEIIFNDTFLDKEINMLINFDKDIDLNTFKSYSEYLDNGFIGFGVNFTATKEVNPIFTITTNEGDIKIINSGIKGHLMIIPYGVDFEGTLLVNGIERDYTVEITRLDKNSVKVKLRTSPDLANDDIVVFKSETLFGLNLVTRTYTLNVDNTNPSFSSIGQKPTDIIETTKQVNLSVNITDVNLNISAVKLYWKINLTNGSLFCWDCVNKTQHDNEEWKNSNDSIHSLDWNKTFGLTGTADTWQFNFSSIYHDIFNPHTSQIHGEALRNLTGTIILEGYEDIYGDNIVLVNVTNLFVREDGEVDYDIEFMAKSKTATKISDILEIGYCNSSFTTGDVTTSDFCQIDGAITTDDSTDQLGFYEKVVQANTSGYFGDVKITENGTIFFISTAPNSARGWQLKWVNDSTTDSEARTSSDKGITTTAYNNDRYFALEVNMFSENFTFDYLIQAEDFAGNRINSTVVIEVEELANEPPTECIITSPTEGDNISSTKTITWTESLSDVHSFYYNISLYNTTTTQFGRTLGLVYRGTETLSWDTTGVSDKNYTLSCQAIENVTDGSVSSNLTSTQIFTGNFTVDNTAPVIILNIPTNNTLITDNENPNVNFRISSSETVKNCSLFLSNGLVGNESTQKKSHNWTIENINFGVYTWNATCYDLANNLGTSGVFNLEIKIVTSGGGQEPESAGGGGLIPIEINYTPETTVGYTLEYICQKVRKFIEENTINNKLIYDYQDIVLLQEEIMWEKDKIISYNILKNYVDNYEKYCVKKEEKPLDVIPVEKNETIIRQIFEKINQSEIFKKFWNFDIRSYIRFPFSIDLGQLKYENGDIKGFFNLINIMIPLSVSDEFSENPNVQWEGGIRILPLVIIAIVIISIVYFKASAKKNKKQKVELVLSPDAIQKKKK